jgi:hypothetical protein
MPLHTDPEMRAAADGLPREFRASENTEALGTSPIIPTMDEKLSRHSPPPYSAAEMKSKDTKPRQVNDPRHIVQSYRARHDPKPGVVEVTSRPSFGLSPAARTHSAMFAMDPDPVASTTFYSCGNCSRPFGYFHRSDICKGCRVLNVDPEYAEERVLRENLCGVMRIGTRKCSQIKIVR